MKNITDDDIKTTPARKATLDFNLDDVEGSRAFAQAIAGEKLCFLLYSFDQELRSLVKYGGLQDETDNDSQYDSKFADVTVISKEPGFEETHLSADAGTAVDAVRTLLRRMLEAEGLSRTVFDD